MKIKEGVVLSYKVIRSLSAISFFYCFITHMILIVVDDFDSFVVL